MSVLKRSGRFASFVCPPRLQRILCSTSALAMFEPGLGSCCRLDWGETGQREDGGRRGERREDEEWKEEERREGGEEG